MGEVLVSVCEVLISVGEVLVSVGGEVVVVVCPFQPSSSLFQVLRV